MFAIVISEKGGAERREFFDRSEVTIGRVQGNDLMLPKGNVSKRHAQLLFRDSRFIIKDLKSTNGTYLNGRKITQATLVREGDKIYVGDFVLRVEMADASAMARLPATPPAPALPSPPSSTASDSGTAWDGEFTAKRDAVVPHEAEAAAVRPRDGSALPQGVPPPRPPLSTDSTRDAGPPSTRHVPPAYGSSGLLRPDGSGRQAYSPRSTGLALLVERVSEAMDLTPLQRGGEPDPVLAQRVEHTVRERAKLLADEARLPEPVEREELVQDALRELLGLGTLDTLLADEDVHEIRVFGHDRITVLRSGEALDVDPCFSSPDALLRVIARLCRQSGQPLAQSETILERQLPSGTWLQAILPTTALYDPALTLRRRRRVESGLDDFVRNASLSRQMATFLHHCIGTRANVLVVGAWDSTASLVAALTAAGDPDDHLVAVQQVDELWGIEPSPYCIRLPDSAADANRVLHAVGRLHPDRLVVSPIGGNTGAEVLALISQGARGVIATAHAPSLRHAAERLVPDIIAARPGLGQDAAAAWLTSAFDIAAEITRFRDGRLRVTRIGELVRTDRGSIGVRDIFSFAGERTGAGDSVEGAFTATGVVPRMVQERGTHGIGIDLGLFKRA